MAPKKAAGARARALEPALPEVTLAALCALAVQLRPSADTQGAILGSGKRRGGHAWVGPSAEQPPAGGQAGGRGVYHVRAGADRCHLALPTLPQPQLATLPPGLPFPVGKSPAKGTKEPAAAGEKKGKGKGKGKGKRGGGESGRAEPSRLVLPSQLPGTACRGGMGKWKGGLSQPLTVCGCDRPFSSFL